jgi:hypothetical protein
LRDITLPKLAEVDIGVYKEILQDLFGGGEKQKLDDD